jgi:predicted RNA-binding Zn ribbon-like protein
VHFNHDGRDAVHLGVDLANHRPTNLTTLVERCTNADVVFDAQQPVAHDYITVDQFLTDWEAVAREAHPPNRAKGLNALLAEHGAPPRLTDHANTGWHLHFRGNDVSAGTQIAALIAVGTAFHLAARGIDRLGVCAADTCTQLYADTSRNGRQRYCSPTCGNRMAVRRYRHRPQVD